MNNFLLPLSNLSFNVVGLREESAYTALCALKNGARITSTCRNPGLSVEALSLLQKALGFRYHVIWVKTFEEIEQIVSNGTADFTLNFFAIKNTDQQAIHLQTLPPLHFVELGFVSKRPDALVDASMALKPFSTETWLVFLGTFFFVAFLCSIREISFRNYFETIFRLWSFTLNQDDMNITGRGHNNCRRNSIRIFYQSLITYHAIFLFLIQNLYSAELTSFFYPAYPKQPYDSSDTLAPYIENGERILAKRGELNRTNSWFLQTETSNVTGSVRMRKAMQKTSIRLYKSYKEFIPFLKSDRRLVAPISLLTYITLTREVCSVLYVKDNSFLHTWESIAMRQNFPYKEVFEKSIRNGIQNMMLTIAQNLYYKDSSKSICQSQSEWKTNNTEKRKLITLGRSKMIFMLLIIGGIGLLPFAVFCLELITNRLEKNRRHKTLENNKIIPLSVRF